VNVLIGISPIIIAPTGDDVPLRYSTCTLRRCVTALGQPPPPAAAGRLPRVPPVPSPARRSAASALRSGCWLLPLRACLQSSLSPGIALRRSDIRVARRTRHSDAACSEMHTAHHRVPRRRAPTPGAEGAADAHSIVTGRHPRREAPTASARQSRQRSLREYAPPCVHVAAGPVANRPRACTTQVSGSRISRHAHR